MVIAKIFNTIIKNRLTEWTNNENILPELSFGFRKNISTANCINYVCSEIRSHKEKKKKVIPVFMDISRAYDTINLQKLCDTLDKLKSPASLTNWIVEFFNNRTVHLVRFDGNISKTISKGIPQGSALSPTIFNIYTTKLHRNVTENTCLIQYADDLVIIGWNEDIW